MKKIVIYTYFDTCYIGENRINNRFSFVNGVITCKSSCPEGKIYIEYDENSISLEEIKTIICEMKFQINKVEMVGM